MYNNKGEGERGPGGSTDWPFTRVSVTPKKVSTGKGIYFIVSPKYYVLIYSQSPIYRGFRGKGIIPVNFGDPGKSGFCFTLNTCK